MSAVTPVNTQAAFPATIFRLTVWQYHELMHAGILTTDDRVELLEGVLVQKMTKCLQHTGTVLGLRPVLQPQLPAGYRFRSEQPIVLGDGEPEPDGVIALGMPADDFAYHPPAAEVALVIEVSDSTLDTDRRIKLRSYARAGIPVYWIVNLIDRQVEVHTDPDPAAVPEPTYRTRTVYAADGAVPIPVVGTAVAVADLLPPG